MITITEEDLKKALDQFGEVQGQKDLLAIEKSKVMKQALKPEIQAEIESIDEEFKAKEEAIKDREKKARKILDNILDEYAKSLKLQDDETVKSDLITVTFYKPEVEWDTAALDGYILAGHPELLSFRHEKPVKTRVMKNKL